MVLPQKVYEVLRWVVIVVIPAAITLYGVIGNTCHIPNTDIVLTIAGAVDVFLGTIFGISKLTYDARNKEVVDDEMGN
jgi:branched-subunit amino acid transport protein